MEEDEDSDLYKALSVLKKFEDEDKKELLEEIRGKALKDLEDEVKNDIKNKKEKNKNKSDKKMNKKAPIVRVDKVDDDFLESKK